MSKTAITIYSDGACSGNPGPGGYAAVVYMDSKRFCVCGSSEDTTNNRMELTGFINGIGTALINKGDSDYKIKIYTDSKYVENAVNCGWLLKWEKKKYDGIKNVDLWEMAYKILYSKNTNIEVFWCKGHAGIEQNELADKWATLSMEQQTKEGTIVEF